MDRKRLCAASLIALAFSRGVLAQELPAAPSPGEPLVTRPADDVIKNAVKETLAAEPTSKQAQLDGRVLRSDSYEKFSRQFSEAKVPSCIHPDALKHQPHSVEYGGWVFGVGSIYATPFWVAAVIRGKCRLAPD
jgi:hypothetical protein